MVIIRPLTRDDLTVWWDDMPLVRTVRGFAAEVDGNLAGIAGVMYVRTAIVAFAEMPEGAERCYPLSIMRMARRMRALMQGLSAPVFAAADAQYPNSGAFLLHVGFEHVAGAQYVFKKGG